MSDTATLAPAIISFAPPSEGHLIQGSLSTSISDVMHDLDEEVKSLSFPLSSANKTAPNLTNSTTPADTTVNSTASNFTSLNQTEGASAVQLNHTFVLLKTGGWNTTNFCSGGSNSTANETRANATWSYAGKGWCAAANRKSYWEGMNNTLQQAIGQLAQVQNSTNGSIYQENGQNLTALNLTLGRIQSDINVLCLAETQNSSDFYYQSDTVNNGSSTGPPPSEAKAQAASVKIASVSTENPTTTTTSTSVAFIPVIIIGLVCLILGAVFVTKHLRRVRERISSSNSRYSELDRANVFSSPKQAEKGLLEEEENGAGGGYEGYELVSVRAVE